MYISEVSEHAKLLHWDSQIPWVLSFQLIDHPLFFFFFANLLYIFSQKKHTRLFLVGFNNPAVELQMFSVTLKHKVFFFSLSFICYLYNLHVQFLWSNDKNKALVPHHTPSSILFISKPVTFCNHHTKQPHVAGAGLPPLRLI